MKIFKDMKRWKTIIQFIITVLTAAATTLTTTSCISKPCIIAAPSEVALNVQSCATLS